MNDKRLRVVVLDGGYDNYETERRVLAEVGAGIELAAGGGALDGADALLVRESPVTAAMMDRMPACRAIVRYGIGVDNIDRDAARARKIYVANVPDYGTEEVSDQALALVMAVARRVVTRDREVRDGAWNIGPAQKVYRLAGKTLGLIGYGRIAQAFERKMRGVGMARVMVFDPYATLPAGVEAASVESICREADVVSLHAPLTPETRHILDAQRIALLKPTAIVVNTSRGPLIDEAALVEALKGQRILGRRPGCFRNRTVRPGQSAARFGQCGPVRPLRLVFRGIGAGPATQGSGRSRPGIPRRGAAQLAQPLGSLSRTTRRRQSRRRQSSTVRMGNKQIKEKHGTLRTDRTFSESGNRFGR